MSHYNVLVPTERLIREYDHLVPYLNECGLELQDIINLAFTVAEYDPDVGMRKDPQRWTAMSLLEEYFLAQIPAGYELSDNDAILVHNLTGLAHEIYQRVLVLLSQYIPVVFYSGHRIRHWVGKNVMIESYL